MKPSEIADLIGIASSTIRAWTLGEFKRFFSPSAQGGSGRNRNLNETDSRILSYIAMMKRQNVSSDEIHIALQRMQKNNWEDLPPLPEAPAGVMNVPAIPKSTADAALDMERRGLLREIALLYERINELKLENKDLREKGETRNAEIAGLHRQLAEVETELKFYRAGRLKPEE